MRNPLAALRRLQRETILVLVAWFVVHFCFGGIYLVVYNLYLLRLGYAPDFIGICNASVSIGFALFAFPAGILGTRVGRRKMIVTGICGCILSTPFIPAAMFFSGDLQKLMLVLPFGFYGVCGTLIIVNGIAFLSDSSSDEDRPFVFSLYAAIIPIAGFIGSMISGYLPGLFARIAGVDLTGAAPYGYVLFLPSVLWTLTLFLFLVAREPDGTGSASSTVYEFRGAPAKLLFFMLLIAYTREMAYQGIGTFFNAYLDTELATPTHVIGLIVSVSKIAAVPATLLFATVAMKKFGKRRIIALGGLVIAVSILPIALIPSLAAAAVSLIIIALFHTFSAAAFNTFSQELVEPKWRSLMAGSVSTAGGLGFATVSFGGGQAIMAVGYRSFFLFPALMCAAGAVVFWLVFRRFSFYRDRQHP